MSVPVSLEALAVRISEFGERAYLLTVGDSARPHIASVLVSVRDDGVACGAGRSSRANVARNPTATLLWAPVADGSYSLIVDGDAVADDAVERVTVIPATAVLHRIAGADGDGPTCLPAS
ncbi:MAG: pyridoxamine 5'-phosphate oxidase family protein [Acidimicrobiales bacterium]